MPFPDADRVLYESNPLDEVICQVKFPPILKIDAEEPAGFQEQIRADYPNYESKPSVRVTGNIPPQLAELLGSELPLVGKKAHEFSSRDELWKLSLTRNFFALTCKRYERWEEFRRRVEAGLVALQRTFAPAYFTRIGLRYQDNISRSRLGLAETPWSELLKPAVAALLGANDIADDVMAVQTASLVNLPNDIGQAQFKFSRAAKPESGEADFLIDGDFFTEKQTEPTDVLARLDAFNRQARLFFRWCISDRLHHAMGPRPVPVL